MAVLLRGSMQGSVQEIAQSVGCGRGGLILKEFLKKRGLDVKHEIRMVHDRNEWWGFYEREYMGRHPAMWKGWKRIGLLREFM